MHQDYFLPLHQRALIWRFVRREVLTRYRCSPLGFGWAAARWFAAARKGFADVL